MSTGLMRGDTGGLLNDASLSNPIVSEAIAKWFKNYKLSCDKHHTKALHDTTRGYYTQHYTLRYTQHHQALHGTTRRAILVTFVISCVTIFQI